jgi:hypothetical protein
MITLIQQNEETTIESDYITTEPFELNQPTRIERVGMLQDGRGVYKLTYLLDEKEKQK